MWYWMDGYRDIVLRSCIRSHPHMKYKLRILQYYSWHVWKILQPLQQVVSVCPPRQTPKRSSKIQNCFVFREVVTKRCFYNLKKFINMGTFYWVPKLSHRAIDRKAIGYHQPAWPHVQASWAPSSASVMQCLALRWLAFFGTGSPTPSQAEPSWVLSVCSWLRRGRRIPRILMRG